MGKLTTASTKNRHRHRELASQEARGKPRINKRSVVKVDRRKLTPIALQSISQFPGA
jgi:uncharacterized sporulation protein YeaH/YhbH (DUF444 family)